MNEIEIGKMKEAAREYSETRIRPSAGYVLSARNAFIAGAKFGFDSRDVEIAELNDKLQEKMRQKINLQKLLEQAEEKLYDAGIEQRPIRPNDHSRNS